MIQPQPCGLDIPLFIIDYISRIRLPRQLARLHHESKQSAHDCQQCEAWLTPDTVELRNHGKYRLNCQGGGLALLSRSKQVSQPEILRATQSWPCELVRQHAGDATHSR